MVLGEHFRGHAEAPRPVAFSAAPQSPEQAAVVAGACDIHTFGCRDQLHVPCDANTHVVMPAMASSKCQG